MNILVEKLLPNPDQPRTLFDDAELAALAASLDEDGLLNPIAVEGPLQNDWYVILDGERRWRAAKRLGWPTIKANVARPVDSAPGENGSRLILALVGNLQRAEMGPVDEGRAFAKLREVLTVEEIARRVGRSPSHVYNRVALAEDGILPAEVLDAINRRLLPFNYGMVRKLRELPPEQAIKVTHRAVASQSTVGQITRVCSRMLNQRGGMAQSGRKSSKPPAPEFLVAPAIDVGNVVLGEEHAALIEIVIRVCNRCGMGGGGDSAICRSCPLAEALAMLGQAVEVEEVVATDG